MRYLAVGGALGLAFAFFHGDWATFDERASGDKQLEPLRTARNRFLSPSDDAAPKDPGWKNLQIRGLVPDNNESLSAIARLERSDLSAKQRLDVLRCHAQPSRPAPTFFRLTNVVVYGRRAGLDVTRWEQQLAALRQLVSAKADWRHRLGLLLSSRASAF